MKNKLFKITPLALSILASLSTNLYAAQEEKILEEIEVINVTGSRISRTDIEGIAPIVVFSKADIEASPATNIGQFLQRIPSVTGPATSHASQFSNGSSTATLRGLSARNTLVLLNGRRLGSSGIGGSSDLNTIPMSAIKSIEVLQDGASAVYGSDAIAGVVNVIMDNDFEGFKVKTNYGISSQNDNAEKGFELTYGIKSENGNILVNFSRNRTDGYVMAARDVQNEPDRRGEGGVNLRDPLSSEGSTYNIDGDWWVLKDGADRFNSMSDLRPYNHPWDESWFPGDVPVGDKDGFNYWLYDMGSADLDTENIWISGAQQINNDIEVFFEYLQNNRKSLSRSQPYAFTSDFGDPVEYSENNDYNTFGQSFDVARALMELGPREVNNIDSTTSRIVIGAQGSIYDWEWDISFNHQRTKSTNNILGVSYSRVLAAAGDSDECRDRNDGCVPIDLMGKIGSITPDMLSYIQRDAKSSSQGEMDSWQFNTTGDVFDLPAGTVQVAFGLEYRQEHAQQDYASIDEEGDRIFQAGLGDTNAPTRSIKEFYGEINIPLLSDAPLAQMLEIDMAARYSDYSDFGSTTTPKIGIRWQPIEGLLVRSSKSEGFRAPGFDELYSGLTGGWSYVSDPCAEDDYASKSGCPQGLNGPSAQATGAFVYSGGNADLQPEESKSLTAGIVWAPTSLPGFSISLDMFDIEKTNVIRTTRSSNVVDSNSQGEAGFDGFVERRASDGQITAVYTLYENSGYQNIKGYDTEIKYAFDTQAYGSFDINLIATRMTDYDTGKTKDTATELVGNWYEGSGSYPEYKATLSTTWQLDNFTTVWSSRFVDKVVAADGEGYWLDEKLKNIDSYLQHDAQFGYKLEQWDSMLTVGIENVFDQAPPYIVGSYRNGYDAHTFSSRGRFYYARLSINF